MWQRESPHDADVWTGCWIWDDTNSGGYASGRSPREPFLATHGGNRPHEPLSGVPPIGVVVPVHQVGDSDTDSV